MRCIVVTFLVLAALTAAPASTGAVEPTTGFLVDGDVVCGAIGDVTDNTDTALFSYDPATGEPIRPAEVRIGDAILPGPLFSDAMLGVMELHYVASTFEGQTVPDPFCVQVEMDGDDVVAVVPQQASAIACGRTMTYGMPVWLGIADVADDPAWSLALPGALTGFDETTVGNPLNISIAANVLGGVFCAFGDAVTGEAYFGGIGDVTIASRTADSITIAGMIPGFDTFRLTSGSVVEAALLPGTTSCVDVRGYGGADGRVEMRIVDDPGCTAAADAAPMLPDVAMELPARTRWELIAIGGLALVLAGAGAMRRRRGARVG